MTDQAQTGPLGGLAGGSGASPRPTTAAGRPREGSSRPSGTCSRPCASRSWSRWGWPCSASSGRWSSRSRPASRATPRRRPTGSPASVPRYGGWTDVLDRLQLFSVFGSIWFRGLTAFLTISLLACMIQRAPGLWHGATKPRVTVGDGFFAHARERDAIVVRGDAEALTAQVTGRPAEAPLPGAHGRRRRRQLLRGPLPLGAVRVAVRPPEHRRDPGRRHGRRALRLPRQRLRDRGGLHRDGPDPVTA